MTGCNIHVTNGVNKAVRGNERPFSD